MARVVPCTTRLTAGAKTRACAERELDPAAHPLQGIVRGREHLDGVLPARSVVDHHVGERAPDVDPDRRRGRHREPSSSSAARAAGSPRPPPPDVASTKRSPVRSGMLICFVASSSTVPSPRMTRLKPRLAARAALPARGRQFHAITANRQHRVRQQLDVHLGTPPTAELPVAAGSRAQLGAADEHRIRRLQRFDLRDHRAPAEEVRAVGIRAVRPGARADASELVEQGHPALRPTGTGRRACRRGSARWRPRRGPDGPH